jgi:ParB family chromosome partitioning protein
LGAQLGKSRSYVANTLRLLSLPEAIQELVLDGSLSAGHARALIGADKADKLAQRCVKEGLSVRALEAMVKRAREAAKPPVPGAAPTRPKKGATEKDADTLALERDLESMLGLKVSIDYGPEGGKLTIQYKTLEQLDDVLRRLNQVPYREFD